MSHDPVRPRPRAGVRTIVAVAAVLVAGAWPPARPGFADEPLHPLEAANTSSPRATLQTFLDGCNEVYGLISERGGRYRAAKTATPAVNRIFRCLDLSQVPPALQKYTAGEVAVCLKEVLDRIELRLDDAPGPAELEAEDGELKAWRVPHTEITIARAEEGPRKGQFLFNPETVERAVEFYERVEDMDYQDRPDVSRGFMDWYLSEPGWMIPVAWIHAMPQWTRERFLAVTVWQWVGLVLTLSLGLAAMWLAYWLGRQRAEAFRRYSLVRYWLTLAFPLAAMLVPQLVEYFLARQLAIRGPVMAGLAVGLDLVFLVAAIVVVFSAASRLAEAIIASPKIHPRGIDAQLIRLGFRVFAIVAAFALFLEGGRQLGIPLTTLLAGAGVSGLAVALAAQDTLKNFFGSLMIVLDRPFRVGERIVAKDYDGVVEEIGLRSTKIRLLTGHQATIPNDEMARIDVENIGRRPHIRRIQDVALPYDTPPEKVQQALEIVRRALENHEGMEPDFPPRVFFTDFRRDCLNLRMIYWFHPPAYWDFLAHSEKLNTRIMQEFAAAEIRFALPSTTTRMADADGAPLRLGFLSDARPAGPT
jgi:MscS family membrane protein